jgi:hypothetical protein
MPATTRTHCAHCGNKLPPSAKTGRPRTFCGEPCKRAAAYEITRLNRLLERLEGQLADERVTTTHSDCAQYTDVYGRLPAQRIDAYEREISRTRERLLVLLAE